MSLIGTLAGSVAMMAFSAVMPAQKAQGEAQELAEKSVLLWADKTFEYYDGPRFENFHEIPSQEQFIIENKILVLQEFMLEKEEMFKSPENKKTKEEFDASQAKLTRKIDSLNICLKKVDPNAKNYEVHFWANIMVSNAVTVYYQQLMKLDSRFNIMDTKITGKVGTQPAGVKILYKKTATIKPK
ncbi:MAG TPA: hypothetical protein VK177_16600 [Flavobacteriales bacterium]|nr:hypothetical protein [Flavobacteriales bacterium]